MNLQIANPCLFMVTIKLNMKPRFISCNIATHNSFMINYFVFLIFVGGPVQLKLNLASSSSSWSTSSNIWPFPKLPPSCCSLSRTTTSCSSPSSQDSSPSSQVSSPSSQTSSSSVTHSAASVS